MEIRSWDRLVEALPPLASYEFEALKASIAEHGVLQRILVLPDGRIIDGYHRWKIVGNEAPCDTLDLDEQSAFLLGLAMNTARRQMSPNQIKELRKKQKPIALELRQKGKSQEETAKILGITQGAVAQWEAGAKKVISIISTNTAYNPPDLRIKIPKKEKEKIAERVATGESQIQIAADYKVSQARVSQIAKKKKKVAVSKAKIPDELQIRIEHGDFVTLCQGLPDNSIDLILTDPPYPKEYLPLWPELSAVAQRLLRPSGFLIAYSGQEYLPEVLNRLAEHLEYYWLGMLYHRGPTAQRFEVNMWNRAKPILFFYKPPRVKQGAWLEDVIESPEPDKDYHKWGQNPEPFKKLLTCFSQPGEIILDPFAGGGSVIQAAIKTKRNIIAFEKDTEAYNVLNSRFLCKV